MAVAAIERQRRRAGAQMAQRVAMRRDQIADVDVVADAGSVGRRIIGAENIELRREARALSRPQP